MLYLDWSQISITEFISENVILLAAPFPYDVAENIKNRLKYSNFNHLINVECIPIWSPEMNVYVPKIIIDAKKEGVAQSFLASLQEQDAYFAANLPEPLQPVTPANQPPANTVQQENPCPSVSPLLDENLGLAEEPSPVTHENNQRAQQETIAHKRLYVETGCDRFFLETKPTNENIIIYTPKVIDGTDNDLHRLRYRFRLRTSFFYSDLYARGKIQIYKKDDQIIITKSDNAALPEGKSLMTALLEDVFDVCPTAENPDVWVSAKKNNADASDNRASTFGSQTHDASQNYLPRGPKRIIQRVARWRKQEHPMEFQQDDPQNPFRISATLGAEPTREFSDFRDAFSKKTSKSIPQVYKDLYRAKLITIKLVDHKIVVTAAPNIALPGNKSLLQAFKDIVNNNNEDSLDSVAEVSTNKPNEEEQPTQNNRSNIPYANAESSFAADCAEISESTDMTIDQILDLDFWKFDPVAMELTPIVAEEENAITSTSHQPPAAITHSNSEPEQANFDQTHSPLQQSPYQTPFVLFWDNSCMTDSGYADSPMLSRKFNE